MKIQPSISIVCLSALLLPIQASAQQPGRLYFGGLAGAHHESSPSVGGTAASRGAVGGVRLTRAVAVEVEATRPTQTFSREREGTSVSFAAAGATREEIERLAVYTRFTNQRTVRSTVSIGAVFAPAVHRRWATSLFTGVTTRFVEEREATTPLRLPAGVDPARLSAVRATDRRFNRTIGALTVGAGVAFAATRHLWIGPDVRMDYGMFDGRHNGLRTSLRAAWKF